MKSKNMEKPKILVNKDMTEYAQCNFCLDYENVYTVRGDRLTTVMSVCKECIEKIKGLSD